MPSNRPNTVQFTTSSSSTPTRVALFCFIIRDEWMVVVVFPRGTQISTVLINGCGLEGILAAIKSVPTKSCHETRTRIQTSWHKTDCGRNTLLAKRVETLSRNKWITIRRDRNELTRETRKIDAAKSTRCTHTSTDGGWTFSGFFASVCERL